MSEPEASRAPVGKLARNERVKLEAQTLNAAGLGIFAVGALQPIFAGQFTVVAVGKVAFSSAMAYLIHVMAKRRLSALED